MSFQIKYVYQLVDKISPQIKKINSNFDSSTRQIRKAAEKTSRSFDVMSSKLKKVGNSAKDMGKNLSLKASLPLAILGGSFIKAASEAQETSSKFKTVFSEVGVAADNVAKDLADNFGLSSTKSKELLSSTGDLLAGFGFTGQAALDLAEKTNKLAVDLTSFQNFAGGAEEASRILTKALLGERDALVALGSKVSAEDVKKKVAIMTAQGLVFETQRQAEAYATLELVLKQSKNAIGDYKRTQDSFSNSIRDLKSNIFDLRASFGELLLPIATKLSIIFADLATKFNGLDAGTKKLILVFGGLGIVIPPLLITFGLMATAITAISAPIAGAIVGITSLIALSVAFKDKIVPIADLILTTFNLPIIGLIDIFKTLGSVMLNAFDSMIKGLSNIKDKIINSIVAPFDMAKNKIQDAIGSVKGFLGFGNESNISSPASNIANPKAIQSQTKMNMGGSLDINFRNAPQGTSSVFTPVRNNALQTQVNSVFAGS